jgi:Pyruvate/2-oxoacid:ferredoxin oxidoreductase delta subunit
MTYADNIGSAEEWSGFSVGLEVDEADLTHEQTRAYKRGQFVDNMARAGQQVFLAGNPALLGAKAVADRIKRHTQRINDMQKSLEETVGSKNSQNRRHLLTQARKLVLSTVQVSPALANVFELEVPVCDSSLCSMCGDCSRVCTLHACDLDSNGHFSVEPAYCVGCGACAQVCEDGALMMAPCDPLDLVVPDPNAAKTAEQRAMVQKAKAEGRKKIDKYVKALHQLGESIEESIEE